MYNIYQHDKKLKLEQTPNRPDSSKPLKDHHREHLTAKYKERMNSTLLQLNKQAEGIHKPRAQTSAGSTRMSARVSGSMTDQERILKESSWNSWLDPTPNEKSSFRLRPREKSKEIQPFIKFRAKSGIERIKENLDKQREIIDTSIAPHSNKKVLYKDFFGTDKLIVEGGKEIMDYYHFKTHFKTIESLAMNLHSSTRNLSKAEIKKKHNDEKLGMTEVKVSKDLMQEGLCIEDVMPMSSEVLEKFRMWEGKKTHTRNQSARHATPRWDCSRVKKSRKNSLM
jgi:hypothetical protein